MEQTSILLQTGKFLLIIKMVFEHNFDINNNKKSIKSIYNIITFCSLILERWEMNKTLQFVKEDIIEGLDNQDIPNHEGDLIPILIPF